MVIELKLSLSISLSLYLSVSLSKRVRLHFGGGKIEARWVPKVRLPRVWAPAEDWLLVMGWPIRMSHRNYARQYAIYSRVRPRERTLMGCSVPRAG